MCRQLAKFSQNPFGGPVRRGFFPVKDPPLMAVLQIHRVKAKVLSVIFKALHALFPSAPSQCSL